MRLCGLPRTVMLVQKGPSEERDLKSTRSRAALACVATALVATGCGSGGGAGKPANGSGASGASAAASKAGLQAHADKTPKFATVPPSTPIQSGVVQIAYRNIAIEPDVVKVKVGSTIKWTNYDPVAHNVVSEGGPMHFASHNFGEGSTFQIKVTKTGIIHYECTLQPTTMNGTIEVVS
jgi:plastocyanin